MPTPRIGLWLIGARGGVASTAIVGLSALARGLAGDTGLVSHLPEFRHLPLAEWGEFLVAGHEIRSVPLADEAAKLITQTHAISAELGAACREDLEAIDRRLRPGTVLGTGPAIQRLASPHIPTHETPRQAIARLQDDLRQFTTEHGLEHTIVINVASTEPPVDAAGLPGTWDALDAALDGPVGRALPASTLYAIAALDLGYSYINFTPSLGSAPPAIDDLAHRRNTRHMGCDGKTGETLLKSTLAPMFRNRNLRVMSWVGHNIFGNLDAVVLSDPANKQAKIASKDHLLREILGYRPQTLVSIEYIESLGDWKTAWDHVHFQGFLGTPMTFQFIWQGCDSLLAAPLVLDLARFTELAWRRGQTGRMTFLASFFKSPYGVSEQDFGRQFQMLQAWAATPAPPRPTPR